MKLPVIRLTVHTACSILLLTACSEEYDESVVRISSKNTIEVSSQDFTDYLESVEFIPLQTDSIALFATIVQVAVTEKSIILRARLTDNSSDAHLYEFRHDGSFVRKIGSLGEGPGEYHSISNFVLRNDTLMAIDNWNERILYYDIIGGEFIKSISTSECSQLSFMNTVIDIPNSSDMLVTSNVSFAQNPFGVGVWTTGADSVRVISPSRFTVDGWISYSCGFPTLSKFDEDCALAILPIDNNIYKIRYSDLTMTQYAVIDDGHSLPEFEIGMNYAEAQKLAFDAKSQWLTGIFATSEYILVNQIAGTYLWSIDKSRGYFTLNGWDSRIKSEFPFLPTYAVGTTQDGGFICAYDAEQYLGFCEMLKPDAKFAPKSVEGIEEDSNPVLVVYKLK